jgi:hypothetical protein
MNAWKTVLSACLTLAVLAIAPAVAAPSSRVTVTAAAPSAAYQGDMLDVVVTGSGFDPSAKVQYFVSGTTNPGGITVKAVRYANSGELITTLVVSSDADLANFDIQVTLDNGRKGKGTTLFKVSAKPGANNPPPPDPTYPAARFWHAFASNGGTTGATSRLYMFGGAGGAQLEWQDLGDLWVYDRAGSSGARWTFVPPGSTAPGPRHHTALSCGGGFCVLSNGVQYSTLKETWVFAEAVAAWSQVNCGRRYVCPSARAFATLAYDPVNDSHVLFGGSSGSTAFNDTYTFTAATMKWISHGTSAAPSPRDRAAATFVPPVGRIVLFGGQQLNTRALADMYVWKGSAWAPVEQVVDGTLAAVPSLHSHSIAWDPTGNRLVVTGGLKDTNDTPNTDTFYVTFTSQGGVWRAAWTKAAGIGCQSTAGSSDPTIHPGARMAFDVPTGTQVFFGGVENIVDVGAWAYDNTVECR